ncbi:MAG: NACHT domain-containing protein [Isosphaeraceae bacterium]
MPLDLLAVWSGGQAVKLVFWPILEDVAKNAAKGALTDFCKGAFKRTISIAHAKPLSKALCLAVKELVVELEEELLDHGLTRDDLKALRPDVRRFVDADIVKGALGGAFEGADSKVSADDLAQGWQAVGSERKLPGDFSWAKLARRMGRRIQDIRAESPELREILEARATIDTAQATRQIAGLQPGFDLLAYRQALQKRYQRLNLESLDTTGLDYTVTLWSVFVPQSARASQDYFPRILELPKEHLRRLRKQGLISKDDEKADELDKRRRAFLQQPARPVIEIVQENRGDRIVFLGDPGAGKSALLRYLALDWAKKTSEDPTKLQSEPLPLLFELRQYDRWDCPSGKGFLRFLHEGQVFHRFDQFELDKRLRTTGGVLFLLDGLDEVFDPVRRGWVVDDIIRLSNDYPAAKMIVTSRVIGYNPQLLRDAGFRHFVLEEFDRAQVHTFISLWHAKTCADIQDRPLKQARLERAIEESPAIAELAGNPLLLTMMAILNRNQELPRERTELYQQASRVLLQQWDAERALISHPELKGTIRYPEKAEVLRRVAWFMQSGAKGLAGNIVSREDLEKLLREYLRSDLGVSEPLPVARALVDQLRERNFILCHLGEDNYAFVHRTFLEYYCALEIVERFEKKKSLSFEQLRDEFFGEHYFDESWHEVLSLIAGLLDPSFTAQLIEHLLSLFWDGCRPFEDASSRTLLAAQCFHEVRNTSKLTALGQKLVQALENLLDSYADVGMGVAVAETATSKAVGFLARPGFLGDPFLWLVTAIRSDTRPLVRSLAVSELARTWRDDPRTLELVCDRIQNDPNAHVRLQAVMTLAEGWRDEPRTLELVRDRILNDPHAFVRLQAVMTLVEGCRDEPRTLELVRDRILNDPDVSVRGQAVSELARGWRDDHALELVRDRILNDPDKYVRQHALDELEQGWPDHADLPRLRERLAEAGKVPAAEKAE